MITEQQRAAQTSEMYGNHIPETATHSTYLDSQDIPREGHLSNAELGCNVNKEEATTEERPLEIPQGWLWSDEMDAPSLSAHGMTRLHALWRTHGNTSIRVSRASVLIRR